MLLRSGFLKIFFSLILSTGFVSLNAQPGADSVAYLTRYKTNSDSLFKIPLTNFCFIKNAGLVKNYNNGWIMKWDVGEKAGSSLLMMEMNSSDVEGWLGNGDISGSVQVAFELPRFDDSIILKNLTEKSNGLFMINNDGGPDAKKHLHGTLKVNYKDSNAVIDCSLYLTTNKPSTKQQLTIAGIAVPAISFSKYQLLQNNRDSLREANDSKMAQDISIIIALRDSIWRVEAKKQKDSLLKHPYTGPFRFWASHIDKAEWSRITYEINQDSLIVREGPYDFIYLAENYPEDSVYYKASLSKNQRLTLAHIGQELLADTLKESYFNNCIMDGLIVSFAFEWPKIQRSVTVSNYYNDKIAVIINYINKICPKKYRIWYDKETLLTQQENCHRRNN